MLPVSQAYLTKYAERRRRARYRCIPVEPAGLVASSIKTTITDEDFVAGRMIKGFSELDRLVVGVVYQGGVEISFRRERRGRDPWDATPIFVGQSFQLQQCYESADGTRSEWVTQFTGWANDIAYVVSQDVWRVRAVDACFFLGKMFASDPKWEAPLVLPTTFSDLYTYINICMQQVIKELGLWAFHLPTLLIHGNSEIADVKATAFRDIVANIMVVSGTCMMADAWGNLVNCEIKLARTPYVIPDPIVVLDYEIDAYDTTITRVGVSNGAESWIYPENEGRFKGATYSVYSMFSPYSNKWHAEVMWDNLGGYVHKKWRFNSAALPMHLEPEDHIVFVDKFGISHELMIGYMEIDLTGDPEWTCGLGDWVTSIEIASNAENNFTGASAAAQAAVAVIKREQSDTPEPPEPPAPNPGDIIDSDLGPFNGFSIVSTNEISNHNHLILWAAGANYKLSRVLNGKHTDLGVVNLSALATGDGGFCLISRGGIPYIISCGTNLTQLLELRGDTFVEIYKDTYVQTRMINSASYGSIVGGMRFIWDLTDEGARYGYSSTSDLIWSVGHNRSEYIYTDASYANAGAWNLRYVPLPGEIWPGMRLHAITEFGTRGTMGGGRMTSSGLAGMTDMSRIQLIANLKTGTRVKEGITQLGATFDNGLYYRDSQNKWHWLDNSGTEKEIEAPLTPMMNAAWIHKYAVLNGNLHRIAG